MVRETRLESESKSRECFEQLPWHGCRQGHTRGDSVLPVNRDEVASPWDSSKPQPPTTTRARPDPISAMTGLQHLLQLNSAVTATEQETQLPFIPGRSSHGTWSRVLRVPGRLRPTLWTAFPTKPLTW